MHVLHSNFSSLLSQWCYLLRAREPMHVSCYDRSIDCSLAQKYDFVSLRACVLRVLPYAIRRSSVFGVLQSFPLEKPVLQRELESGSYRSDTWYMSRSLSEVSFQFIFPIIFCSITFWMMGLRDDFGVFLTFTGIILLATNAALSYGYMISALAPSVEVALAIGPVTIMPMFLFSGFFINTESIPVFLIWL